MSVEHPEAEVKHIFHRTPRRGQACPSQGLDFPARDDLS